MCVYAQLIECRNNNTNIDFSLTNAYRYADEYMCDKDMEYKILSEPFLVAQWELCKIKNNDEQNYGPFLVHLTDDGVVSAIRFWFRLDLALEKR